MKLWLLRKNSNLNGRADPWEFRNGGRADKTLGLVVRAADDVSARIMADTAARGENETKLSPWLRWHYTQCDEVSLQGEEEILLSHVILR